MLSKEWLPFVVRKPLSRLVKRFEPWCAQFLDAVTVATQETRERFGDNTRVIVIHNFPWRGFASQAPGSAAESEQPIYDITYHGVLHDYYLDEIIRVATALVSKGYNYKWCIAAREHDSSRRETVTSRIEQAGLSGDFEVEFNLPFSEMPRLLATTRVGYIPWRYDPAGLQRSVPRKLFEFMAFGIPAVAPAYPGVERLVGGLECAVLVDPADIGGAADALESLLEDPVRRERLGVRGKAAIAESFNAEVEVAPYVEFCTRRVSCSANAGIDES